MKQVIIDWNFDYYSDFDKPDTHYSQEDVVINENGWVTIQQDGENVIHYSPRLVNTIWVKEKEKSNDLSISR